MAVALELAAHGRGRTSPNPMVGAVVVRNGRIVGRGFHEAAGKPHAEVNAIEDAGDQALGADLYVTLEPCNHTGRTPPCTETILRAGIRRVVAAMRDPNPRVAGGGLDYLSRSGLQTVAGILEAEARRLNESFVKFIQTGRPFVILKCAATLDGRIATRTGDSKWISNEQSRAYGHELRHAVDGVLVGINTIRCDDPLLTARLETGRGKDPARIVLDTRLSIDPRARVLSVDSEAETLVVCGCPVDAGKKAAIEKKGVRILEAPVKDSHIDMRALMPLLGQMEITSVLIEGGGRVSAAAVAAGIVDKVVFFYAPKILGGDDGVPIFRGVGPRLMSECIRIRDIRTQRFGDDVMIEGYVDSTPF